MSVLVAIGWLLASAAADVTVTIAPDQPLPYVYTDDPLVLELISPKEVNARVRLRLQAGHQSAAQEIPLGDLTLPAGAPRWCAIKDAPSERGYYTLETSVEIGDEVLKKTGHFCRVDRPSAHHPLALAVAIPPEADTKFFLALKSIGVKTLRLNTAAPDFTTAFVRAHQMGFMAALEVDPRNAPALAEALEGVAGKGAAIARWEVPLAALAGGLTVLDPMRKAGGAAAVFGAAKRVEEITAFFAGNKPESLDGYLLAGAVLPTSKEVASLKRDAAQQGLEDVKILVRLQSPPAENAAQDVLTGSLGLMAAGVVEIGLDADLLYASGELTETAAYLNGLAVRMNAVEYIGDAPLAEGVIAEVFRKDADWFMALWSKRPATVDVPLDGVVGFTVTDALGNALPGPTPGSATISIEASLSPKYLSAVGGVIPGKAAAVQAEKLAQEYLQDAAMVQALGNGVRDTVTAIQKEISGPDSRGRFLELARQLPRLEELWHTGQVPTQVAVPAMQCLSDLTRALCLVEDDRGEHFLEPLSDTIARCEELQSLYLTGSTTRPDDRPRGEWLLGKVRQLVDEAESLEKAGRKVEASAVAVLAEWRAKGLPMAARAVTGPAIETAPPPAPSPAPTAKPAKDDVKESVQDKPADKKKKESEKDKKESGESAAPGGKSIEEPAVQGGGSGAREVVHVVSSGDNPYVIAKKYGVDLEAFLTWNNLKKSSRLNIGDKLVVRTNAEKQGSDKEPANSNTKRSKKKRSH